ncbi:MAG: hypothetical protein DYG89_41630 [Caldilinea sp. CFX5]|nr:hypothetical protein [Caldilinea sp. CFX5]
MQEATSTTQAAPPAPLVGAAGYHSYLVRIWQTHPQSAWRASALCVQTGTMILFADLATLCTFLSAQTGERTVDR